jgi:hypothetical protein
MVGPLTFITYTNDLSSTINTLSQPIIFADDTSVVIYSKRFDDFCVTWNILLSHMNKQFTANKLAPNLYETNIIKFITNNSLQYALCIGYNEKYINASVNTKFLGLQIDNHLNETNNVDKPMLMLSRIWHAVRFMLLVSNTDALKISLFFLFWFRNKVWNNFLE